MFRTLLTQLWNDETGAVISTEYLLLGSVVAVGSASGMAAMRDSIIDEYKDLGGSIHEVRQQYAVPVAKTRGATHGGTSVTDPTVPQTFSMPTATPSVYAVP